MASEIAEAVQLITSIVATGAQPVAVLSILVNVFQWRERQKLSERLEDHQEETIRLLRAELERTKSSDNRILSEMAAMASLFGPHDRRGGKDAG